MRKLQNKRVRLRRRRAKQRALAQPTPPASVAAGLLAKLAEPLIPKKPWVGLLAEQNP
jgi:hypothetical protein